MKKSLFLIFMLCLTTAVQSKKEKAPIPNNGLVMYFDPFTNSKTGPMYERVTRKSIQTYDPATGTLGFYKREEGGCFDSDEWGFMLDSCLMVDTDLKLPSKNAQMTIMLTVHKDNEGTTPGPIALMRIGQPDSLWYIPITVKKNRMIYMEGRPTPDDSVMVKSRWHYEIESSGKSTIFILIDQKTGQHSIYMEDAASVFYNDRLSQLPEMPNRLLFLQQENTLIHRFAFWNRLLTEKEIHHYYTADRSKEYAEKHPLPTSTPIVGNADEADGVFMHGWGWGRWGCTIGLSLLIIIWFVRRMKNIRTHYAFSGSPLIIIGGIIGTAYLQYNLDFDIENIWIYNTINILAYYFISFRADPLYTIRKPGGVAGVFSVIGAVMSMLAEIIDSIPTTTWEITYINRDTGEKTKKTETHMNLIVLVFWLIVISFAVAVVIVLSEVIFYILPLITVCKFVINYLKERKLFKEAEQQVRLAD